MSKKNTAKGKSADPVLLSWIAYNNDPFERDSTSRDYLLRDGSRIPGPTLTLLFDSDSSLQGRINDLVLFTRVGVKKDADQERQVVNETKAAILEHNAKIQVRIEEWTNDDPTDHQSIFEFLRKQIPILRRMYAGRELVIHASPGTPSMQMVWVLMAETGFIDPPFQVVKSYRESDRHGRPPVVPLDLGIETFYKMYKASLPGRSIADEEAVLWDPARFQSSRLNMLYTEARRFAQLKIPILLLGERGTGKTTIATWIRQHSPYCKPAVGANWPVVPCGQYTSETMRAELFGYKKGAFTDAKEDKEGLLVLADKDTLFLDEIGDISKDLQRLMIKVLEEKRFHPLGDSQSHESDFRLLTATNLSWETLKERVDTDFLDRISLLRLRLPALREIPEDIPWLWETVFQKAIERAAVDPIELGQAHHDKIIRFLQSHPLPGNLRDLFRVSYLLLACLSDPQEPLSPHEAVEYALVGLQQDGEENLGDMARNIARSFSRSEPLDYLLSSGQKLEYATVEQALKGYLGQEIRRLAKAWDMPVEQLCDVGERSLRNWVASNEEGER
jgi:DNA-binding NtrC family response regulator